MTAHHESVVGTLRYLINSDLQRIAVGDDSYEARVTAFAAEHAPALLAALEKVWALCDDDGVFRLRDCSAKYALGLVNEILAPLFTQPETPPR